MKKLVAVTSLLLSSHLSAFESAPLLGNEYVLDEQWEWGFSVSRTGFDDSVLTEGIENSALGFSFDVDYIKNNWITTISAQYLSYDDNYEFSQYVVGSGWANSGDESTESSDASGTLVGIATGHMYFFGETNDVAVIGQAGVDFMASSKRSIAFCDDCNSEDIDVDGGLFLKAGIVKDTGPFNLGLNVKTYLSGDLGTTLSVSFGSTY
jgi:hypothetical protein